MLQIVDVQRLITVTAPSSTQHAADRRACIKQRLNDRCAACWHVPEGRASGRGGEARHVDVVLHRKGHAPQALARRRRQRLQLPATPLHSVQVPNCAYTGRSSTPKQTATDDPETLEMPLTDCAQYLVPCSGEITHRTLQQPCSTA